MSDKKGFWSSLFGDSKKSDCCHMEIVEDTNDNINCGDANCDCNTEKKAPFIEGALSIKILSSNNQDGITITENIKLALSQLGIQSNIEKVTDINVISEYSMHSTLGLVINEKLVSSGKILKPIEIVKLIEQHK